MGENCTLLTEQVEGINLETLTFDQLKQMVGTTEDIYRVPTKHQLFVREEELLFSTEENGALITVFKSGLYIYHSENGSTVHAVDRCNKISYLRDEGTWETIDEVVYKNCHWSIPIIANAENRIEHNGDEKSDSHYAYTIDVMRSNWDPNLMVANFEDELLDSMNRASNMKRLNDALLTLSERQLSVITMRYWDGLNDLAIAKILSISQPAIWKIRARAIEILKRNF